MLARPTLDSVSTLRYRVAEVLAPEEHDLPPAQRSRRDWIVDTVLFVVSAGLGAAALADNASRGLDGPLLVIDVIAGTALCIALWWRRRWPLGLGLVSLPILVISSSAGFAGAVVLYTVAAYRRWQPAAFVAGAHILSLPVYYALFPEDPSLPTWAEYGLSVLGTAAIVAWGMYRRGRRQAQRERARRAEVEEQLRVEQIRHAERTRIAREMHDVLAHRISLLSLHAGALEFRPDASPEEVARAAAVIRANARQALEDLRGVIGVLRDGPDGDAPQPPQPTLAALPGLLAESRAAGMRLQADIRVDPATVPDAVGRHALRVVQEALTNVRKHAPTATVDLLFEGAPGRGLTIEVSNPAPVPATGRPDLPGSGTGLVGLAERAALSGGRLEYGLGERGDFRLRAWLPWT